MAGELKRLFALLVPALKLSQAELRAAVCMPRPRGALSEAHPITGGSDESIDRAVPCRSAGRAGTGRCRGACNVAASHQAVPDHAHRRGQAVPRPLLGRARSEAHTSELQSLMRNSYAVFCLKT